MDYNNYESNNMYRPPVPNRRSAGMETAAFALGIVSIATCTCIYVSVVCGALAVMFALLSKGGATSMSRRAKYALILGIVGMVTTVVMFTISLVTMLNTYGSLENMLRAYCDMTGLDFEELYGNMFTN